MRGVAVMALGLIVASCNKDINDPYANQAEKQEEFNKNFSESILNGQAIDANQTWSTATATQVTVKSDISGTLRIYTANPHGNVAAALLTQTIEAGSYEFTVTKPVDAEQLYAKLTLSDGSIRVVQVNNGVVSFDAPGSLANAPRRAQKKYNKDFPDTPDANIYKSGKPNQDTPNLGTYQASDEVFYVDESNSNANVQLNGKWGSDHRGAIYVVTNGGNGIVAPSYFYMEAGSSFSDADKAHLYICPGATLKLNSSDSGNLQAGLIVSIARGATLECEGLLKLNSLTIYNNGTIKAPEISANGSSVLYNQNKIEVTGDLTLTNATSFLVNEGIIEVGGNYGSQGSGSFWNVSGSTMTVTGKTIINSNCNGWINEGVYSTGDNFEYTAGSIDVWNNCKLTVGGQFYMVLGSSPANGFSMESGASVVAETANIGACTRINMGGNCLFKVNGTMTMNNTNHAIANGTEGFFGPTSGSEYAVIQAKNIVRGSAGDGNARYVAYVGNIYVAADSHFAEGPSGTDVDKDYYLFGNAKVYGAQNKAPYTIPSNGRCNGGYTGDTGGGSGNQENTMYYYYAFEDLGTSDDFDFNDVVIRVSAPSDGESTVDLMAAGGTMQTFVTYGEGDNPTTLGSEVHTTLGQSSIRTMINTNAVDGVDGVTPKYLATISVASGADMTQLPFGIKANGSLGSVKVVRSVENNGNAPLVIVVCGDSNGKWFWPKERVNISTAFPNFGAWGANAGTNTSWYQNSATGQVYTW